MAEYIEKQNTEVEEEGGFQLKELWTIVVLNWQWFVLSLLIFVFGAFIYLRYKTPVYSVSCKMLIKDEDNRRRSNQMLANMKDLGFMSNSAGIENEVEILKSTWQFSTLPPYSISPTMPPTLS